MLEILKSMSPESTMWTLSVELLLFVVLVMQWRGKLPPIASVAKLADVLNTKGGNILLLWMTSMIFFAATMRFTYWVLGKVENGKLDVSNAFALAGFTFISGNAFGGAFSSMLKTMTGESMATANKSDNSPNSDTNPKPPSGDKPSPNQAVTAPSTMSQSSTETVTPVPTNG